MTADGAMRATVRPERLTVLYDANCAACRRARHWAGKQRQLVPLEFVPAGSLEATRLFPGLDRASTLTDVTVVADDGAVFRGERGWVVVLWALASTRPTADAIAHGRRTRMFRAVKGATEAIRKLTASSPDPGPAAAGWPPPDAARTCEARER